MAYRLTRIGTIVGSLVSGDAFAHEVNFEERVRAYLLNNPQVILDALEVLSSQQAQSEIAQKINAYPDVFHISALGLGSPDATTKVVEFFDYRCAPCKAVHPALVSLTEENPDLRIEMRHLPILSPGSERAARFALAIELVEGAETYRAVHNALWTLRGPFNEVSFRGIANDLGFDFEAVYLAMQSPTIDAEINRNRDIAIDLEIFGTPAFISPNSVGFGSTDVNALAELWLNQ